MKLELYRSYGIKIIPSPDSLAVCIVCETHQKLLGSKCIEKRTVKVPSHDFKQSHENVPLVIMNTKFVGARN